MLKTEYTYPVKITQVKGQFHLSFPNFDTDRYVEGPKRDRVINNGGRVLMELIQNYNSQTKQLPVAKEPCLDLLKDEEIVWLRVEVELKPKMSPQQRYQFRHLFGNQLTKPDSPCKNPEDDKRRRDLQTLKEMVSKRLGKG